jgi:hypothetical protein
VDVADLHENVVWPHRTVASRYNTRDDLMPLSTVKPGKVL